MSTRTMYHEPKYTPRFHCKDSTEGDRIRKRHVRTGKDPDEPNGVVEAVTGVLERLVNGGILRGTRTYALPGDSARPRTGLRRPVLPSSK
jgi:hypothetical protein